MLRATRPWLIEVRHADRLLQRDGAREFRPTRSSSRGGSALLVVPRFQNDERFAAPQIEALFGDVLRYDPKVSTAIFFGLRNQVIGYPDHLAGYGRRVQAPRLQLRLDRDVRPKPGAERERHAGEADPRPDRSRAGDRQDRARQDQTRRGRRALRPRRARAQRSRRLLAPVGASRRRSFDRSDQRRDGQGRSPTSCEAGGFRLGRATPIPPYHGNNRAARRASPRSPCRRSSCCCSSSSDGTGAGWPSPPTRSRSCSTLGGVALHHDAFARSAHRARRRAALCGRGAARPDSGLERSTGGSRRGTQLVRSLGWTLRGDRRRAARRARRRRRHELAAGDGRDRAVPRRAARARRCRRSSRSCSISSTGASVRASQRAARRLPLAGARLSALRGHRDRRGSAP